MFTFSGTIALGVRTTAQSGFAMGREAGLNSQYNKNKNRIYWVGGFGWEIKRKQ